nr:retrovirus-related Pol polyprotein from transposon TNT 1-94 [Tanacetum cinerariifolium]
MNSKQRLHLLHMDLCSPMRVASINEAARTMLIFSRAPLFLWAEAIATACFTQNRSIIHRRFNKTPYELINGRKLDISFFHVFSALCYPKNDHEDIGKLGTKGDIGFFIGYSADSCAYRIYNRRTKKIMETINVLFDELSAMAFEQRISKPMLQSITSGQISSGLDLTYAPSTITSQQPSEGELDLLFEAMYDDYIGGQPSATGRTVLPAQEPKVRQSSTASTTIANTAPIPTNSSSLAINILITSQDVDEHNSNAMVNGNTVYNQRTNKIIETINVTFDELSAMAFEQNSSKPGLQKAPRTVLAAPVIQNLQAQSASMSIQDSVPTPTNSLDTPISSHNVDKQSQLHAQQQGNPTSLPTASAANAVSNAVFKGDLFVNPFATPST